MKKILKNELYKIIAGLMLFVLGILFEQFELDTASFVLLLSALIVSGAGVFYNAVRGILRLDFLDEKFLMSIASIGAFVIGESVEGVAVMLFFLVGEYFEHKAVRHSRNSIKELMDICPDTANVIANGIEETRDAEDLEVGEKIVIRSGERVPLDCIILSGKASMDTSSITGEHLPREVEIGDTLDSGTVVIGGVLFCKVLRKAENSAAARIIELVESATDRKSREESFITKFSRYYTPIVTVLAFIMAVLPPILNLLDWNDSVYRALSFLVVSCPCALVISVPMAFFGGIGGSASRGILFKGGNTFSPMAKPDTVIFDKTGTLTTGKLTVSSVNPISVSSGELLTLAASSEYSSGHPIAEAIKKAAPEFIEGTDYRELSGLGVVAKIGETEVAVGNRKLLLSLGIKLDSNDIPVGAIYVARNNEYIGYITLGDTVKAEAREAIERLKSLGVNRFAILSGDERASVERVAHMVGIDEFSASLLPEEKYQMLEKYIEQSSLSTVYVGDGINDAPCIARADVGIAMGALGTDSAIEASDAVIMSDNLFRLSDAIKIARKTIRIAKENIVFAIGIKLLVLLLVSLNVAGMWMAVFADVGVAILAILNAMRTLRFKIKN